MPGCTHSRSGYDDRVRDTTPRANLNPLVSIMVTVKFTLENMDNKPREEILNHVIEHYLDAELAEKINNNPETFE